ncbi:MULTISPECIES: hypothetical protein [Sporomusa]|uniref:hypothetical protein n=1 Tax=Sporomusa TaxID=2375 RepID=UPI00166D3FF9|nr:MULTISPECIES: hypothetical protein [Sporomusa]MCM0761187.1 hypothetical protein [Sporomusa sphaeroides DSM 2875]
MLSLIVWIGFLAILPLAVLSLLLEGYDSWLSAWQAPTWTGIGSLIYLALMANLLGMDYGENCFPGI